MKTQFGSFAWAMTQQGKLSTREKIQMLNAVLFPSSIQFLKTQCRIGNFQQSNNLDLKRIQIPDTAMVKGIH